MQHLRIVGVHDEENVPQLILSDESGREFALPLDEALRHAVARPPVRTYQASASDSSPLTPREIQARLRAGATVDQVVSASGLTAAHVDRYAGPVHAERAYIAQRARATQVAPASAAEAHRLAFGDEPASLEAMVTVRLRAMDVDLSTLSWDSWRGEDGLWHVTCVFDVDSSATHGAGIGLKPPAEWTFQPVTRHLRAVNRWAESLSELSTPVPTSRRTDADHQTSSAGRRLSAVDSVFDVEDASDPRGLGAGSARTHAKTTARNSTKNSAKTPAKTSGTAAGPRHSEPPGRGGRTTSPAPGSAPRGGSPSRGETVARREDQEHEDLLDVLRARRGQRLGADAEADDRLALMLNRQDPQEGGGPLPVQNRASESTEQDDDEHATVPLPRLRPVTAAPDSEADDDRPGSDAAASDALSSPAVGSERSAASASTQHGGTDAADPVESGEAGDAAATSDSAANDGRLDAWGFAYEGEPEDRAGTPAQTPTSSEQGSEPTEPEAPAEKPRKRAPARRASMPKWDDILFGSKED